MIPKGGSSRTVFQGQGHKLSALNQYTFFFLAALRYLIGASVSCIMNFVDVCQLKWTLDYNIFYKASCIP